MPLTGFELKGHRVHPQTGGEGAALPSGAGSCGVFSVNVDSFSLDGLKEGTH